MKKHPDFIMDAIAAGLAVYFHNLVIFTTGLVLVIAIIVLDLSMFLKLEISMIIWLIWQIRSGEKDEDV